MPIQNDFPLGWMHKITIIKKQLVYKNKTYSIIIGLNGISPANPTFD